jgi:hypothetical protein
MPSYAGTTVVLAHGLGGRSDLPVPLWLALYGGAAAVVVSFVALGALWPTSRLGRAEAGVPVPARLQAALDAPATRAALRGITLAALLALVVTASLGPADPANNPAPTWLYVWFWVGLVPASLLLGPVWPALNPLRALSRWLQGPQTPSAPPPGLAAWPAVAWLGVFVWLELVYARAALPVTVLVFVLAYVLFQLGAALRYGQGWYARGDAFEVYSVLLGHLAPLGRRGDGRLVLRNPLDHLAALRLDASLVGFIGVLLGSTAFDGLTRTVLWEEVTAGRGQGALLAIGTAGLVVMIALVVLTYVGAVRLAGGADRLPQRFAHSLVPIAVGYTIAHYFSFLVFQGQAGYLLASDPLGAGWDLFGTAAASIDYTVVSPRTIALVQVGAIVLGHVAGVVAAHDRAVGLFTGPAKTRSQYPLLGVMVTYTVGGIALLVGA